MICADFGVGSENIHVLATEATRGASNSGLFRETVKAKTGWEVNVLGKEEEGRIGALGVASSSGGRVNGLAMDLGGGSVQLTWVGGEDGVVTTAPAGLSFPYGAAALKARLEGGADGSEKELREEIKREFRRGNEMLEVPGSLDGHGLDLYLSGGGFRGWGYLLMNRGIDSYPIPIINGYRTSRDRFGDVDTVKDTVSKSDSKVFGVSKRRRSQIPAVAYLVDAVMEALPVIRNVQFCQGGVREGFLFDKLPVEIRRQDPVLVATSPYASESSYAVKDLLQSALPMSSSPIAAIHPPDSFSSNFLQSLANLLFAHSTIPKETRSAAALHSTTTGLLAPVNNFTHTERALLALILCERWAGDLPPADELFRSRLYQCVSTEKAWWARYLGRVATMIGDVYPSGLVPAPWRIQLDTEWASIVKKKERCDLLRLRVECNSDAGRAICGTLKESGERIEKVGKKKKWIEGYGVRVDVTL